MDLLDLSIFGYALVLGITLLFLYTKLKKSSSGSGGKAPPVAAGAWPIIGHLPLLGGPKAPHESLGDLGEKYGPAYMIRIGVHPALVVNSSDVAKEIFTVNDMYVSSRSEFAAAEHLGYNYAMFGFSPYGQFWREMRKITMLEVLSNHRIDQLKKVFVSEIEGSMKLLYNTWADKKNGSGKVLVEMKKHFSDLTLNVIMRTVAGKRYSVGAEEDQKEVLRYRTALRDFFHLTGMFVLGDAVPFLRWLDFGGYEKKMKKTAKALDEISGGWLDDHRKGGHWDENKKEKDFMDVMNSVLKGASLAGYDADTINKATSLNMILAGSDTTTVTLIWGLSLMLNKPHVLKKAQEELDTHIGRDRFVNEPDIGKLVYIQAIVKETLRMYPPAPLSAPRELSESCSIGGYDIPKGTRLIINLHKIQRDPKKWPEPSEFKPERFLTTHKDIDVKGQHFELMPFGSGRRSCPGTSFALHMLYLTMSNFLHAFDFSTPSNGLIDLTGTDGLTNIKSTPLQALVSPRLAPELYN
ncbi:cytochrome P450 CYP82D47-like [Gossypium hirsutum]|uniref:Cytochrome P450 CYP82D47-like n=2 Tax=Gossypium TaxID=3633 RepID=A0A0D5W390_GOSHI|nr:cytochrome P450 CYP82D47-like [Gossypium hirsutum]AJZ68877.1 gossypol pathway P450 hydroxylase [Gossypium hirsutum]AJZ68878.1 gossypol pathway P450 hydroxylase [Gossypium hirsutum]